MTFNINLEIINKTTLLTILALTLVVSKVHKHEIYRTYIILVAIELVLYIHKLVRVYIYIIPHV